MITNINTTESLLAFTPLLMSACFVFLLLFIKKKKNLSDILLNIFILFLAIIQLEFFLVSSGDKTFSLRLLIIFTPAFQSLAILQYLYIKSLSSLNPLTKKNWLHFTPPILSMLVLLIINMFFNSFIVTDTYWNLLIVLIIGGTLIINFIYIPKSLLVYKRHKKNSPELFSYSKGVDLKWMRLSIIGYILFFVSIAFIEIVSFKGDHVLMPVVYSLYLFYLIINGLKQRPISDVLNSSLNFQAVHINYKTREIQKEIQNKNISESKDESNEIDELGKYKSSSLKDDEKIKSIVNTLLKYLIETKAYLNPKLNLMDVSKNLGINYKYISQAINLQLNKNFIRLISEYRVEEAKSLISDPEKDNLTLEAIGELCGFQSKSTFYSAFKKISGKTPMQFKESK